MSGTSLDGLDLCFSEYILEDNVWKYKVVDSKTVKYNHKWVKKLRSAPSLSGLELSLLSNEFGSFIGDSVSKFIGKRPYDLISSHGHTVFHQTHRNLTLQIGNGAFIAAKANKSCVCDFRTLDVALNGQGAPLVPVGDRLLFSNFEGCLNLGGFANISHTNSENITMAFDICPVNIVLNKYAQSIGLAFDNGGNIASNHSPDIELLKKLDALEFYEKSAPKSLGIEWVEACILPLIENSNLSAEVVISTFTQHIANQINKTISKFEFKNLLVTGGGAYNTYLISLLKGQNISVGNDQLIEYKEAIVFGLLGVLRIREEENVWKTVTGAKNNSTSGQVFIV